VRPEEGIVQSTAHLNEPFGTWGIDGEADRRIFDYVARWCEPRLGLAEMPFWDDLIWHNTTAGTPDAGATATAVLSLDALRARLLPEATLCPGNVAVPLEAGAR
jgi:hypothetical protein